MRFTNVMMIYFIMGAVFWGAGLVGYGDAGALQYFIDIGAGGAVETGGGPIDNLLGVGGIIGGAITAFAAPLIIIWSLVQPLLTFINWPIVVLSNYGAPAPIVVLVGGGLTAPFYLSMVRLIRRSA